MDEKTILLLLVIMVVANIYVFYKDYKKGGIKRLKYSLKISLENFKPLVSWVLALYAFIFSILIFVPTISERLTELQNNNITYEHSWVYPLAKIVGVLFVCYFPIKIFNWGYKPIFKYSEQEKQWRIEDRDTKLRRWLKSKLPKLFKDSEVKNDIQ